MNFLSLYRRAIFALVALLTDIGTTALADTTVWSSGVDLAAAEPDRPGSDDRQVSPAASKNANQDEGEPYLLSRGDAIILKFYKHADISNEFAVRADGTISVPLLGSFQAAGKTVAQIETLLADALSTLTKRPSFVSVEVSKYRPVYVVGWVERGGSFPWAPDLYVLQAVSLAGGFARVHENFAADADREAGQATEAAELLARTLVRRSRLVAEAANDKTLADPKQLQELIPGPKVKELLESEQGLLQRNLSVRQAQKENLKRMLTLAEEEVEALSQRLTAVKSGIEIKSNMAATMKNLLTKGNTTLKNVSDVETEVARLESEQGQLLADLAQAKQRLNTATFDLDRNDSELLQELYRLIADTDRDVAKYTTELATARTVLKRYGAIACTRVSGAAAPEPRYQIIRRVDQRVETLDVSEKAPVKPGDTIRVLQPSDNCKS